MKGTERTCWFFEDRHASWFKRTCIGVICILVYLFGFIKANPFIRSLFESFIQNWNAGPKCFVKHVVFFSLTNAVLCYATLIILVKFDVLHSLSLKRNIKSSLIQGTAVGLIITVLTILQALMTKTPYHFRIDPWEIAGNLFSNAYEEMIYRGLIFTGLLYFFRKAWPAILVSGLIFGLSHHQYVLWMRLGVGVTGMVFGYLYYRTGNLLAPWTAHQIIDTIVDTLVKM